MRPLKLALAVALGVGGLLSVAGAANATMAGTSASAAADRLTSFEQVDFIFGGRKHCWYTEGWNGPGWYWCGYNTRKGRGWGGGEGYRGWKH
jgi:hypothetical protein